jgi:hypothetical protein
MDLHEKSMPVTCAPYPANRMVYSPGPQPKSAIVESLPMLNLDAIHCTDRLMKAVLREATSPF